MKTKELLVGVDEFTLILQPRARTDAMKWLNTIEAMLRQFLQLSRAETIFGVLQPVTAKLVQGYSEGLSAVNQPFYFIICWHEFHQNTGIAIRFSAHAWAYFQAEYEAKHQEAMNIARFLQMVRSDCTYTMRLSRIDFTVDYKNYGLCIDRIYQDLKKRRLHIVDWKRARQTLKMSALEKEGIAETIYLGSRRENTQAFLRIYDKRSEQIARHGFRLDEAEGTGDWVRFETVFKGKYAHQITARLLADVSDPNELQRFIAQMVTDRHMFFDAVKNDVTGFTDELLEIAQGSSFDHLRSESLRNNSLRQSIRYLVTNAGLMPVVYKIQCLYGDEGVRRFWRYLQGRYQQYEPNRDTEAWVRKHRKTMSGQSLDDSL